jgi:hypothetical protein
MRSVLLEQEFNTTHIGGWCGVSMRRKVVDGGDGSHQARKAMERLLVQVDN